MNQLGNYVIEDFNLRILSQVNEELPIRCDGFINRIGISADLKVQLENGTIHTFKNVPSGETVMCRMKKVFITGSTMEVFGVIKLSGAFQTLGDTLPEHPVNDWLYRFRFSQFDDCIRVNNPAYVLGNVKNDYTATNFNGVDQYINCDDSSDLFDGIQNSFSVSTWLKPDSGSNTTNRIWLSLGTSGAGGTGFQLLILNGTWKARFVSNFGFSSTLELTPDAWNHVVFTNQGTNRKFYINNNTPSTNVNTNNTFNADELKFASNTGGTSAYFKGSMDDLIIYNRELSASEVSAIYGYRLSA